ncbi:MAG: DEAD/DEAH box helicase [Candidatus Micrarchaeota archaeon]|nr:DEAD/DEAH box helicase [Candidatus Micrarchaeota archaeon]
MMLTSELKGTVPNEMFETLEQRGIKSLTPPQETAVKMGLLKGGNFLIASPTASGKTFIAEMAMLNAVLRHRKKAVYVAPMRALVNEKYEELKEAYPFLKIAMSIGDLDSLDQWLSGYDIVFVSTEKFDSLIRHGLNWLDDVGCVVVDEVHMLDDPGRGPTLEILITKLRRLCAHAQILALSATVGNAKEVAQWLDAELVESDYRPVRLEKGVTFSGRAYYLDREEELDGASTVPEVRIVQDTLSRGKQILVFYSTKRNAEASAERLSQVVEGALTPSERVKLAELGKEILHALSKPTAQCEKEAKMVARGVAFHHSGLVNAQRHAIENAFKANLLKVICSTPTLALGVNLPAHTVLVRDTSRYSEGMGSEKLSVNEVTQLFGRAGRPKYDKEGRGLLIAKAHAEIMDLYQRYINAELEPISSKLGVQPILRMHVLAFIATRMLRTKEGILAFLKETLYGYQFANTRELEILLSNVLNELELWRFVDRKGSVYEPTRIGQRVSELYIDPLSAKWLIDTLPKATDDISYLFTVCNTLEMRPHVKATEEAFELLPGYDHLLEGSVINYEVDEPEKSLGTALALRDWANETPERDIVKSYNTTPGTLFVKLNNADWMLYASTELAKLIHVGVSHLLELRVRTKYGVRKELLDLIRLEQVGRVRARLMYNNGIRRVADLRLPGSAEKVQGLFGKEVAKKILEQL